MMELVGECPPQYQPLAADLAMHIQAWAWGMGQRLHETEKRETEPPPLCWSVDYGLGEGSEERRFEILCVSRRAMGDGVGIDQRIRQLGVILDAHASHEIAEAERVYATLSEVQRELVAGSTAAQR